MKMGGVYNLILKNEKDKKIEIGSIGEIEFKSGFYTYTGSALGKNGFKRIWRHVENFNLKEKSYKRWWHVDYLKDPMNMIGFFFTKTEERAECIIAKEISKHLNGVEKFGCSDCNCASHLHYSKDKTHILEVVLNAHDHVRRYFTSSKSYPLDPL